MSKFIFIILFILYSVIAYTEPKAIEGPFLNEADINWKMNDFPIHRWKTLVGGIGGGHIEQSDIRFGTWELAPKATYHGHKHETPEIYYIISGKALWTVGDKSQEVTAGTAIYTNPNSVHKMVNLSDEVVKAIWIWWAPNGDTEIFDSPYLFTEDAPKQPDSAKFKNSQQ